MLKYTYGRVQKETKYVGVLMYEPYLFIRVEILFHENHKR